MRLGVLDIGSNTVHLLVVDAHHGAAPVPAHSHKIELRLAENLTKSGDISAHGQTMLAQFVDEAVVIAENLGVAELTGFATSAVRDAPNGRDVIGDISKSTGVTIEVLSGEDEAKLTFLAVRRWFGWSSGRLLVFDIGGGSLEISGGIDEDPDAAISLPLGAGRLTSEFLRDDPPTEAEMKELRRHVRVLIAGSVSRVARLGTAELAVATSKTFRQIARILGAAPSSEGLYVPREINRDDLRAFLPKLSAMTTRERQNLPGVSSGRAGQLIAGALVADAVFDLFDIQVLRLCPWALREGVILRRLDSLAN